MAIHLLFLSVAWEAEVPLTGVTCTMRYRDSADLPLGSSMAVMLEIINTTDQPVTLVGSFPAVRFQILAITGEQGDVAFATGADQPGARDISSVVPPHVTFLAPVFLAPYFSNLEVGRAKLRWKLGLRLSHDPREGYYEGELAVRIVPPDQHLTTARVAELIKLHTERYDITGSHAYDRREIVEELCAIDDPSVVAALRAVMSTFVGEGESGCRILRAMGDRWADPGARQLLREALNSKDSSIIGESLSQYFRHLVFVDQQTLIQMLDSPNASIGWQALYYQQRVLDTMTLEQFNSALTQGWVPIPKITGIAQGESTLAKLAKDVLEKVETRKHGKPSVVAPDPEVLPTKDASGF